MTDPRSTDVSRIAAQPARSRRSQGRPDSAARSLRRIVDAVIVTLMMVATAGAQTSESRPKTEHGRAVAREILEALRTTSGDVPWPTDDAFRRVSQALFDAPSAGRFPIPGADEAMPVDFAQGAVDVASLRGVWIKSRGKLSAMTVDNTTLARYRGVVEFAANRSIIAVAGEFRDDSKFPENGNDVEFVGFIYAESTALPNSGTSEVSPAKRPVVFMAAVRPVLTERENAVREARRLIVAGDYVEARRRFEGLAQTQSDYDALAGGGIAAFHLSLDDKAADELFRANRLRPYEPEPLYYLGLVRDRVGRNELEAGRAAEGRRNLGEAIAIFRECARRSPDPFDVLFWAAEGAMLIERYGDALDDIRAAAKVRPDSESAAFLELKCLEKLFDWRALLDGAVRFRGKFPPSIEATRLETFAAVKIGDEEAAKNAIESIESTDAFVDQSGHLQVLFDGWNQTAHTDALLRILNELAARRKDDVRPLFYLGLVESYRSKFPEAIAHYDRYLALRPTDPLVAARRIQLLRLSGKRAEAENSLRKCLAEGMVDDALLVEGQAMVARFVTDKKFAEGYELQRLLYEAAPNDPTIARGFAVVSKETGALDAALAIYDVLAGRTDLDPAQLAVFKNERGLCLKGLGRLEEAEKAFRDAASESPIHVDARENLGVFLFDHGRLDEAKAIFEEVLTIEPGRERTSYYLRRCRGRSPESRPTRN